MNLASEESRCWSAHLSVLRFDGHLGNVHSMYRVLEAWIGSEIVPAWAHINICKRAVTGFPSADPAIYTRHPVPLVQSRLRQFPPGNIGAMRRHEHSVQDRPCFIPFPRFGISEREAR